MLLAIDTASRWMSIALFDGQRLLGEHTVYSHNQHTVMLTQIIQEMLVAQGVSVSDLAALGISAGPGSYSGLRVGFSVAKGIATARKIPLVPVATLDTFAASTPFFDGALIITTQAGRKRIHAAQYIWHKAGWAVSEAPVNTTWDELIDSVKTPTFINGEIEVAAREKLEAVGQPITLASPAWQLRRGGFLAYLAWQKWQDRDYATDLAHVNPIYLKSP